MTKSRGLLLRVSLSFVLAGSGLIPAAPALAANIRVQNVSGRALPGAYNPVWHAVYSVGAMQAGVLPSASLRVTIPALSAGSPAAGRPVAVLPVRPQLAAPAATPQASAARSIVDELAQAQSALSAVPDQGGDNTARVLDALFESSLRKSDPSADGSSSDAPPRAAALSRPEPARGESDESAPPMPELSAAEAKGLEDFVALAKSLFFQAGRAVADAVLPAGLPSEEDMYRGMELSPAKYAERLAAVVSLFQKAGAKPENIILQDVGRGQKNVYVVKPGRTDRVIVVGSHHDMANVGRGTIDNWTGSTMVINLYQAMLDMDTEATYVFASFAREEDGLVGSERYLRALTPEQRSKIDAMVNLDTLAVDGTFSWKNNSSRVLLDMIRKVAAKEKLDLSEINLWGGDADSSSFRAAGIAAMTIFGASPEVVFDIVHSARDTMEVFSMKHYRNAYMLTLALLKVLNLGPVAPKAAPAV